MKLNSNDFEVMSSQPKSLSSELQEFYQQDIETITLLLAKISQRTPDEIKPHLDIMLEQLVQPLKERPFYETASPQEWVAAFTEWVESHRQLNLPSLSDEAISRSSIYGERKITSYSNFN